ncbi:hypothetical protein [Streptomyces sannanensis]
MTDHQEVGAAFAAIMLGAVISKEPPDPASPLGRVLAFTEKYGEGALTDKHMEAAIEGRPLPPPAG